MYMGLFGKEKKGGSNLEDWDPNPSNRPFGTFLDVIDLIFVVVNDEEKK